MAPQTLLRRLGVLAAPLIVAMLLSTSAQAQAPGDPQSGAFASSPYSSGRTNVASTSGIHAFIFDLDGSQVVPPVPTPATGSARVRLNERQLTVTVDNASFDSLLGNPTGAYIRGPAPPGSNAPSTLTLMISGGTSGTFWITDAPVTPAQAYDMIGGLTYIEIETDLYPAGEIRGQIGCDPSVQTTTVIRNGTGVNPVSFLETSPPHMGAVWQTTVDIATPGALASVLFVGMGGAITVPINGVIHGEVLILPPFFPEDIAFGIHNIEVPNACGLVGQTYRAQAATYKAGDIQLTNALDFTIGTY
jgi:hypothetical protein